MNKVFINKVTNMVEQILEARDGEIIEDNYFPNCYMIDDPEGNITSYNLRYNKEEEKFEVIEGIAPFEKGIVEKAPTVEDLKTLKEENENLKARLEKLEELLNVR